MTDRWWDREDWWNDSRSFKAFAFITDNYEYDDDRDIWYDSEGYAVDLEDILGKVEDEDNEN